MPQVTPQGLGIGGRGLWGWIGLDRAGSGWIRLDQAGDAADKSGYCDLAVGVPRETVGANGEDERFGSFDASGNAS